MAASSRPVEAVQAWASRRWQRRSSWLPLAGPLLVYALLVLLGVTNSNIGFSALRDDPAVDDGDQIGQSQAIRSDEYGTESPLWLGEAARGGADAATPLSVSDDLFAQLPDGPASAVVFFDGTLLALGEWMPHEMLFAAKWWLPTLLLFLGLPIWFRQVTGTLRWGYLAALLIFVAPASMWWSGRPVNSLGFVAAGCALAVYGAWALQERRWLRGVAAVVFAGVLLARLPTYYQPLSIVVGVPLVVSTAAVLLVGSTALRRRLAALAAVAVSGAAWTGALFWENREAVAAGLSTVYPGDRQSTGTALSFGQVFGATNLGWLESMAGTAMPNPSELVTAFTVLAPVTAVLFATAAWRGGRRSAAAMIPLAAFTVLWLSWCTVDWGPMGAAIPLVNRVTDVRAAQGVGYLAILAFCLFMAQWRRHPRWAVPVIAGGFAAAISAYAGSVLAQSQLTGLSTTMVWAAAAGTALVVLFLVRWPQSWWPPAVAAIAATALTVTATPVLVGLGDLRSSETATRFMAWGEQSRADGTVWASESESVDSLLTATGTPSLSTRQQIGPDESAWLRLDPDGRYEDLWNRGGLHIRFDWTQDDEITMEQPSPDVVVVKASPCAVAEQFPGFRFAIADAPLADACTTLVDTFRWSGEDHFVYEVSKD